MYKMKQKKETTYSRDEDKQKTSAWAKNKKEIILDVVAAIIAICAFTILAILSPPAVFSVLAKIGLFPMEVIATGSFFGGLASIIPDKIQAAVCFSIFVITAGLAALSFMFPPVGVAIAGVISVAIATPLLCSAIKKISSLISKRAHKTKPSAPGKPPFSLSSHSSPSSMQTIHKTLSSATIRSLENAKENLSLEPPTTTTGQNIRESMSSDDIPNTPSGQSTGTEETATAVFQL